MGVIIHRLQSESQFKALCGFEYMIILCYIFDLIIEFGVILLPRILIHLGSDAKIAAFALQSSPVNPSATCGPSQIVRD